MGPILASMLLSRSLSLCLDVIGGDNLERLRIGSLVAVVNIEMPPIWPRYLSGNRIGLILTLELISTC